MPKSDNYGTPEDLYLSLNTRFRFQLDPCAWPSNRLKTPTFHTEADNGLSKPWLPGPVFVNPPYSNVTPWLAKADLESLVGVLSIVLVRHDPSTKWWNNWVEGKALVIPIPYRLKFVDYDTGKPSGTYNFPNCLLVYHGMFQL
jgi:DNA (cytosine-5)-methyltransferase 1